MPFFTAEELASIAILHNCAVADLKKRWIIQSGKSFYVMGADGTYKSPIMRGELAQSLVRDLQRVPGPSLAPCGIEWTKKKGDATVLRNVDELLADYCHHARRVVADMSLARSVFDPHLETLYEAVCPLAAVTPIFHPQIDEWLRLFAGPQIEKLLDWIATLTRIDRPSSALLITGSPGAGKELLAQGLARRWKWARTPTELGRVVEGFNEDLARCPLVFCDEKLPMKGGRRVTLEDLKAMIAASSRTLSRKFLSNADLVGALRLILAANNNRMLENHSEQNNDDHESVAIRFLHLKVTQASADYLRSIGGYDTTSAWVSGGQLAEHAAWLEQNRPVETFGNRFLVEGNAANVQQELLVNNKNVSMVLEWIARFVDSGSPSSRQILVGNGDIWVNATTIKNGWNQFITTDFTPSTTTIGIALRCVAKKGQAPRIEWPEGDGKVREVKYHSVDPSYVLEWAEQAQVSDKTTLAKRIEAAFDIEAMKASAASGIVHGHTNGTNGTHSISSSNLPRSNDPTSQHFGQAGLHGSLFDA